jgi:hypothetical protein
MKATILYPLFEPDLNFVYQKLKKSLYDSICTSGIYSLSHETEYYIEKAYRLLSKLDCTYKRDDLYLRDDQETLILMIFDIEFMYNKQENVEIPHSIIDLV